MLRIPLAAGVLALCVAVPAFAQGTMSGPSSQTSSMKASDTSSMTCDQMMKKANAIYGGGSAGQMSMMQKEMGMAKEAKEANDESGCKMHAQKAMDVMKR